jgi:hypothetical protein
MICSSTSQDDFKKVKIGCSSWPLTWPFANIGNCGLGMRLNRCDTIKRHTQSPFQVARTSSSAKFPCLCQAPGFQIVHKENLTISEETKLIQTSTHLRSQKVFQKNYSRDHSVACSLALLDLRKSPHSRREQPNRQWWIRVGQTIRIHDNWITKHSRQK